MTIRTVIDDAWREQCRHVISLKLLPLVTVDGKRDAFVSAGLSSGALDIATG